MMNKLRKELRQLLQAAHEAECSDSFEMPFGFANRVVAMAQSKPQEPFILLFESLVRRAASGAVLVALLVMVICMIHGLSILDLNAAATPYAAILTLSK